MDLASLGFLLGGGILLLISSFALLRARDVFSMVHVVKVVNCYIVPLLLIGALIKDFSWAFCGKIIIFIILNIVVSNLICYATLNKASVNKVPAKAELKDL